MTVSWHEDAYRAFFHALNAVHPYEFQVQVARRLVARENILLRAPTGSGKTLTVLTPFLFEGWSPKPTRLIYAVPLRTLAQGIYADARALVERLGRSANIPVTMQTGEEPGDPFFTLGRIIVTTYDQVLSGLLSGPYGLSTRLHNVNSAAVAGALVIFDEFHLMEAQRALLTGAAGLHVFRQLTQSVWMTATATSALGAVLAHAVDCQDASPADAERDSLPSVAAARRELLVHASPLTADVVLGASDGRTLAICNTVSRAQRLYGELRLLLPPEVPVILMHSRFFKPHREQKVEKLGELFGKGQYGRAILVSTQVVEAGVDISCDDLHTEVCPMNALVQRAGRCARYPGEEGAVHVHALPSGEQRPWLPYGDLNTAAPALVATERLLRDHQGPGVLLLPDQAARWVEAVHAAEDRQALQAGWRGRLNELVSLVRQNSIDRQTARVAQYIREESVDQVRIVVSQPGCLPERPGLREAVTVSRWSLADAFPRAGNQQTPSVWSWEFGEDPHWEPLASPQQLLGKSILCVSTAVARYTTDVGLELGARGTETSPERLEPPRPGRGSLRKETWADHARAVALQARRRGQEDGVSAWLGAGFAARYACTPEELSRAMYACGLLHDLGKLQEAWQRWAEGWQRTKEPTYQHRCALAHTDYDPTNPADRARSRGFRPARPLHAAAGAYMAGGFLGGLLDAQPGNAPSLASACLAAILSHHGGWLPQAPDLGIGQLWQRWEADLRACGIANPDPHALGQLYRTADRRRTLSNVLATTTSADRLAEWWPLVAYLVRTLRLSDWRATAEGGSDE